MCITSPIMGNACVRAKKRKGKSKTGLNNDKVQTAFTFHSLPSNSLFVLVSIPVQQTVLFHPLRANQWISDWNQHVNKYLSS